MSVASLGSLVAVTAFINSDRRAAMIIVVAYAVASTIAVALSGTVVAGLRSSSRLRGTRRPLVALGLRVRRAPCWRS